MALPYKVKIVQPEDDALFYQCEKMFEFVGIWRFKNQKGIGWWLFLWIRRIIYHFFLGAYFVFTQYSGVPVHVMEGDYLRAMEAMSFPTAVLTMQIKLITISYRENIVREHGRVLRRLTNRHSNTKNVEEKLRFFRKILYVGLFSSAVCVLSYALYPVFLSGPRFFATKISITYGADIFETPYYELLLTYQAVGYCVNICMAMFYDTLYCGTLSVTSATFKNINEEMYEQLLKDGEHLNHPSNMEELRNENNLRKIVIDFIDTVKFIRSTEGTYVVVNLLHFNYNLIVIAFCLYQSSLVRWEMRVYYLSLPFGSVRWISMAFGVFAVGLQFTIYCHFGQEVATEAKKFWENLYFIKWYNQSHRFKQIILFSLHNTQNELYLSAGKILTLSRETLKNILRAICTYYMFLINVNKFN